MFKEYEIFEKISGFFKKILKKKKKNPNNLREMFGDGLISKEEFFRFSIVQKHISLEKAQEELKNFLKKRKK